MIASLFTDAYNLEIQVEIADSAQHQAKHDQLDQIEITIEGNVLLVVQRTNLDLFSK